VTADEPAGAVAAPATLTAGVSVVDILGPAGAYVPPSVLTQTVTRTLAWIDTHERTLDIDTMSDIHPHDHYLHGESATWEFTIQQDGSEYDIGSADVSWYLLPVGASDPADAVLSDADSGVSLSVTDPDGDGASEMVTLSIAQGVTDGLGGYYTQLLVLDDSGAGLAKWAGPFPIDAI